VSAFVNLVQFITPTTGTGGPLTVGAALPAKRTPAQSAIADGTEVSYSIIDGLNYEYGRGVVGASGTTLTRVPIGSSSGGAAIALSGNAKVAFVLLAEDIKDLSSQVLTFDTLAQFKASTSIPDWVNEVRVHSVAWPYIHTMIGRYPVGMIETATPLTFKLVTATLNLYGEVTIGGKIFAPMYSTNPVNAGEFGTIADGATSHNTTGYPFNGTTVAGSNVIGNVNYMTGLAVGMKIANVNWATLGAAHCIPPDATIAAINAAGANTITIFGNTPDTVSGRGWAYTSSGMVPSIGLQFIAWADTVTGTDNAPMIQAALDFASCNHFLEVILPAGKFIIDDTLMMGWGDSYQQLILRGRKRYGIYGENGTVLLPSRTDRPAIVLQAYRASGIFGITIIGRNLNYVYTNAVALNNYSRNVNDWIAPHLVPTGTNSGGLTQYTPYCGIAADPYQLQGPKPTPHYPDRLWPSWTSVGSVDPTSGGNYLYGGAPGSDLTIEECEVGGFAVNVVVHPYGDAQGGFTRIRNCYITGAAYGIAVVNTQSSNVEIRNINFQANWAFLTNSHFGSGAGVLGGPIDNCSGGQCYNLFDLEMNYAMTAVINNLYVENCVRIGNFHMSGGYTNPVIFNGGSFGFVDYTQHGTIPISLMTADVPVILNRLAVTGSSRICNWNDKGAGLMNPLIFR
jgi:hypothetical protein